MKYTPYILSAAILGAAVAGGCRQQDFRTAEVRVPNVINGACEKRVRDALAPLKGIEMNLVGVTNGVLYVRYDSMQLGLKNIEHAVKDAGFDANEFPADPAARAKLPKECLPPETTAK
jgi:copper chaperone CopZ